MTAAAADTAGRPAYRRRMHYVDSSIQRPLLIAMVALEVVLVAGAVGLAHWRLTELIEASMYRMSLAQTGPTLMRLAAEGYTVLCVFIVVNLIALMLAAGAWSRRENRVLRDFSALLAKTHGLDFSVDPAPRRDHEVLALTAAWRERERMRFAAIRDELAQLLAAASAKASAQELQDRVKRLQQLLS